MGHVQGEEGGAAIPRAVVSTYDVRVPIALNINLDTAKAYCKYRNWSSIRTSGSRETKRNTMLTSFSIGRVSAVFKRPPGITAPTSTWQSMARWKSTPVSQSAPRINTSRRSNKLCMVVRRDRATKEQKFSLMRIGPREVVDGQIRQGISRSMVGKCIPRASAVSILSPDRRYTTQGVT